MAADRQPGDTAHIPSKATAPLPAKDWPTERCVALDVPPNLLMAQLMSTGDSSVG